MSEKRGSSAISGHGSARLLSRKSSGLAWRGAAVLAVLAGLLIEPRGSTLLPVAEAQTAPAPPAVTVSPPLRKEITEWQEFTGQFEAVDYVEIRARVSGYLTEIHFQDGQIVKQGDLLFVIDPRPYEATLASAKAQLAQASAQVDLATRQLDRSAELRKKDFEPAANYDQRVAELKVAADSAEAAKAAIQSAQLNVEFTRIMAPITGRISNHLVSIGNLVSGGEGSATTLLTTIVSLDPIRFGFDMSEADFLAYQRATAKGLMKSTRDNSVSAALHLTDESGWPHEGHIDFVDNQVDRRSGTIRVRAEFANKDFFLTPGQFGRIRIPGSEPYEALLVPDAAVVTDQSRKIVMTVKDDGTVESKTVRPGPTYENLRIIRSGLQPTDRVIIDGLLRARVGAKVTPQPGTIQLQANAN
jgi:RND family efflux transporter MFP subunit